jgi:hypothetical protein
MEAGDREEVFKMGVVVVSGVAGRVEWMGVARVHAGMNGIRKDSRRKILCIKASLVLYKILCIFY